ncbi:hypothetical protein JTE90_007197 [Oedothorax gibbosus]|uniref:G-protein coupled receptors family 2 profile 2 domain-containing protein n=1 Tax=Oedothorax gibbosus TaxID=931172 RepID=A0AAV6UBF9_9ARAC|nr:hypothetical protein JTE90_007197 [Oedothorax gibbosus]
MTTILASAGVFLDIVSFLLDSPRLIKKQSHVLKLHQQILSHGLMQGAVVGGDTFHMFHRSALALEVGQLRNEGQRVLRFPSRKSTREVKGSTQPAWLTDSVELDFNTWVFENLQEVNDSISIAVVFYKNFTAFLPERFLTHYGGLDMEYQLHSRIVAVAVQTGQRNVGGSKSPTKLKVKARLAHLDHMVNRQIMWNISCGVADFSQGNVQFSIEGCQTLQTGNYSLCQCNHVGTYAVLLTTYAQPDEFLFRDGFEVIAGVGCAICAFFVFLTFFILLVLWRKIRGAITALKLQVCFALIGAYATILKALHESLNKDWYPWCVVSIQFFLLAAFSLQLCLALTVYLECASAHARGLRNPELKLAALGWAFPMIVVGATLAAQLPDGFRLNSWWIQLQTNYFYAFSIAVIIIIVLHIMLVMTVKSELNFDNKHGTSKRSKSFNRSCLLNRSLVIILFLLSVSVSSIMYVNFDDELYKYAFSSSSGMLGFMVFLCYTVCSENAPSLCFSAHTIEEEDDENKELGTKSRPGAYQNFLKPEIMSDTFYSGKMPDAVEVNGRVEKLRKQHFPMCPEEIEWKEVDRFLVEKSSIVHDFTVHHQRSPLVVAKANEAPQVENSDYRDEGDEEEVISPLHLQQMDDSPRNSQLLHFKEPDGQEDAKQFYELGVAHPHNTPPDILEPTKQAFFNTPSHQMKVLAHPCLTTFVGEQCVITTGDLDMGQAPSTGSYSTFRPPAKPEDDKIFLQSHSKSPALPRHQDKPLRVPDIGDEPLIPAKKKDGPLQVAAPVVPDKDDQKKGWSITTV